MVTIGGMSLVLTAGVGSTFIKDLGNSYEYGCEVWNDEEVDYNQLGASIS